MRSLICGLCFAVTFAGGALAQTATVQPAPSATVQPGQGDLSVNQGQGFQRVDSRVNANVGDSVMVGPGGSASLVYPDGCQVAVQPGSVVTIAPLSPCASGSLAADNDLLGAAVAAGLFLGGVGAGIVGIGTAKGTSSSSQ
jgi:hypothetical protein